MRTCRDTRRRDDGYILVAVLGVMLLLSSLAAASMVMLRSTLKSARLETESAALDAATGAGLELTAYQLFVAKSPARSVDGRTIKLTGAVAVASVIDEGAKIDINAAKPPLLLSLFKQSGIDVTSANEMVQRIVAFRGETDAKAAQPPQHDPTTVPDDDSDLFATQPKGGTNTPGTAAAAGDTTKRRRGFQSVDQICEIAGVCGSDLKTLAPALTVFNPSGSINVASASEELLGAIPGLTKPVIADILAHRDDPKALESVLSKLPGDTKSFIDTRPGPAYTIRLKVETKDLKRTIEAVVAPSRNDREPYFILDWRA